ncbi:MAG: hypothetical protein ACKOBM_08805, partial [Gammaproteobacteria bacterium]
MTRPTSGHDEPTTGGLTGGPEAGPTAVAEAFTSGAELGAAMATGALDPVAVCEDTLARIASQDRHLHAFRA